MNKTQEKYDSRIEQNEGSIRNLDASLQNLQNQVQILKLVCERTPSSSTNYPLGITQEHAKAITLMLELKEREVENKEDIKVEKEREVPIKDKEVEEKKKNEKN